MSWADLSDWWLDEIGSDPTYEAVVTPLLLEIVDPVEGATYLDLGSGEGRVIRAIESSGASVLGVELNEALARESGIPTIVDQLPEIPVRSCSVDGAYAVLVIEHWRITGVSSARPLGWSDPGECWLSWPTTRSGLLQTRHR